MSQSNFEEYELDNDKLFIFPSIEKVIIKETLDQLWDKDKDLEIYFKNLTEYLWNNGFNTGGGPLRKCRNLLFLLLDQEEKQKVLDDTSRKINHYSESRFYKSLTEDEKLDFYIKLEPKYMRYLRRKEVRMNLYPIANKIVQICNKLN